MDCDVLIAGGGLNGCALALALAQGGLRVALADPTPEARRAGAGFDGRAYALSLSSERLLRAIGLWPQLAGQAQPILHIGISDGRRDGAPSPLTLEFDGAEIEDGPMGQMVEDRHLRPALLAACAAEARIRRLPLSVVGHEVGPGATVAELSDGSRLSAALLVGCDGKTSATARRAGIRRWGWSYGQSALICAVAHERPHEGVAHQLFLPGGPLAILPLREDRSNVVWSLPSEQAAALAAQPDAAFLAALQGVIGDYLGALGLAGQRGHYPLALSVAHAFAAERVALLGDAAHAVHPVAGQGLNAGLKDVGALAEVLLLAHRRGEDIGRLQVLERYQRWRRFDVVQLALATDAAVRVFSNDFGPLRLARDLTLAALGRLAPLRRGLIREAAGLTGEVPRLNRGLPV